MPDIRIKDLTTTASSTASDDFFAADGATNGTRKLSAYSPTFGGNATVAGSLTASGATTADGLATSGFFGGSKRVILGYNTSSDYGFIASVDTGVGWKELQLNPSGGLVKVPSTTASTSYITGALVVNGGVGIAGALYSQQNTNGILAGAYFENASTGNAATIRHRLTAGASTCDIEAYGSGHATLANRLRFGTSNGQIDFIPSGVFTAGLNTTGLMVNPLHTNARHIESQVLFAANAENYLRISANNGGVGIYGGEYGFGLTAAGDPELRINSIHAGTITRLVTIRTGTNVIQIPGTTAANSADTGALTVAGGLGVMKRIHSGDGVTISSDTASMISFVRNGTINIGPTNAATPKLQVGGGLLLANTTQSVPAYGDVGPQFSVAGAVITDTSSSGTVSRAVVNSIAASALAASSTTTYTAAASLFVAGAPTANTNVTITNAYAIYTAGGRINFQGLPTSATGLQAGTLWNDGGTLKVA